jgi:hypothetical protein
MIFSGKKLHPRNGKRKERKRIQQGKKNVTED